MERLDAWAGLVDTRELVFRYLDEIDSPDCTWSKMVIALDQAVDFLYRSAQEFEQDNGAEDFDDIYLPIFDALSFVTEARSACNGKTLRTRIAQRVRQLVEWARKCLDDALMPRVPANL